MLAIHNQLGSFSDRWIKYCENNKVSYKIVNCYNSNIIEQIKDCNGLMWHWTQRDYKAQNFARQLIFSIEKMGIKVFPSFNTCWHFDDKVGQKYLLESINAPLVQSYTFYNKNDALKWIKNTNFPKVFKLRGGASSLNVKLIKNKRTATMLVKKAFRKGFTSVDKQSELKQRFWVLQRDKNFKAIIHLLKGFVRLLHPQEGLDLLPRQKGYIYFQDFIPDNGFDDRIIVIGNRAIAVRRYNRKNDFRASGSGIKGYNPEMFLNETIKISFNISQELKSQSLALDFIYDKGGNPKLTEISYAFIIGSFYDDCPGYWNENLIWHDKPVNPQYFMIEDFIESLR